MTPGEKPLDFLNHYAEEIRDPRPVEAQRERAAVYLFVFCVGTAIRC